MKVQNAKQVNSALKQKMEGGIEEFKPPESNQKINARWTTEEQLLAVQGILKISGYCCSLRLTVMQGACHSPPSSSSGRRTILVTRDYVLCFWVWPTESAFRVLRSTASHLVLCGKAPGRLCRTDECL